MCYTFLFNFLCMLYFFTCCIDSFFFRLSLTRCCSLLFLGVFLIVSLFARVCVGKCSFNYRRITSFFGLFTSIWSPRACDCKRCYDTWVFQTNSRGWSCQEKFSNIQEKLKLKYLIWYMICDMCTTMWRIMWPHMHITYF